VEEAPLEEVQAAPPAVTPSAEAGLPETVLPETLPAMQPVAMAAPVDPATAAWGLAMLVPFASLIIAAIALGAGLRQIWPKLLTVLAGSQLMGVALPWWIAGGLFLLMLLTLAVFNSLLAEKKPAAAGVYQKPKKEKALKKEKKKKK
jgi:hypothetical protein